MSARKDLTGKIFGDFRIVEFVGVQSTHALWQCICNECGFEKVFTASNLNYQPCNCKWCWHERRWTVKEDVRLKVCDDYLAGVSNNKIIIRHNLPNRSIIYKILKKHNIKADRKRST